MLMWRRSPGSSPGFLCSKWISGAFLLSLSFLMLEASLNEKELDAGSCSKLPCSLKPSTQLPHSPGLCLSLGQSPEPEDAAAASAHGCPCTVLVSSPYVQPRPWGWQGCLLARQQQKRVQTSKMEGL